MNSRISIDFDSHNQPFIKLSYEESDDVRDKLVKSFIEKRGYSSQTLSIFKNPSESKKEAVYEIAPVSDELEYFKSRLFQLCPVNPDNSREIDEKLTEFFDWVYYQVNPHTVAAGSSQH